MPRRTETEIVPGTDTVIKRRREIAIKTKIAEKGDRERDREREQDRDPRSGIGIDIAEMIKTDRDVRKE